MSTLSSVEKKEKMDMLFTRLDEFFHQLFNLYPKERDFLKYKNMILSAKSLSAYNVCDRFAQSLMIFEYEIIHENESFFLNYPMDDINVLEGHMELIRKLKNVWNTSSTNTKKSIWGYMQIFISFFKDIYDEIEIVYIKLKGIIALIYDEMKKTYTGKLIYFNYMKHISLCQSAKDEKFILQFSDILQKHKPAIKRMKEQLVKGQGMTHFIGFDYTLHETEHSCLFDWIEKNWNEYNLLVKTTIFKTCLGIIKTAKMIKERNKSKNEKSK